MALLHAVRATGRFKGIVNGDKYLSNIFMDPTHLLLAIGASRLWEYENWFGLLSISILFMMSCPSLIPIYLNMMSCRPKWNASQSDTLCFIRPPKFVERIRITIVIKPEEKPDAVRWRAEDIVISLPHKEFRWKNIGRFKHKGVYATKVFSVDLKEKMKFVAGIVVWAM